MDRHKPTGRWALGLGLALLTAYLWGILPIILNGLLGALDPCTLTWGRFALAGVLLAPVIAWKHGWAVFRLGRTGWVLASVCILGLTSNYVTYLLGLAHLSPGSAQVVVQLGPMFMLAGSLVFYRESFSGIQWFGFVLLVAGIILFFHPQYGALCSQASGRMIGCSGLW